MNAVAKRFYDHPDNQKPGFFDYEEKTVTSVPPRPPLLNATNNGTTIPTSTTVPSLPQIPASASEQSGIQTPPTAKKPAPIPTINNSNPPQPDYINVDKDMQVYNALPKTDRAKLLAAAQRKKGWRINTKRWNSGLSNAFRDQIAGKESKGSGDYQAVNKNKNDTPLALGRYQLTVIALQDAGLVKPGVNRFDENDIWTKTSGIKTIQEFLNRPDLQEKAMEDYNNKNIGYFKSNGANNYLGTTYTGLKGTKIRITSSGMLAAAHRQGATAVNSYLKYMEKRNWKTSDFKDVMNNKDYGKNLSQRKATMGSFLAIEQRLREFQNTRLQKKDFVL